MCLWCATTTNTVFNDSNNNNNITLSCMMKEWTTTNKKQLLHVQTHFHPSLRIKQRIFSRICGCHSHWNTPAQVTLPEWFVLRSQLRVLGSKHLSQQLHHLQPLIIIITLQRQREGERQREREMMCRIWLCPLDRRTKSFTLSYITVLITHKGSSFFGINLFLERVMKRRKTAETMKSKDKGGQESGGWKEWGWNEGKQ